MKKSLKNAIFLSPSFQFHYHLASILVTRGQENFPKKAHVPIY